MTESGVALGCTMSVPTDDPRKEEEDLAGQQCLFPAPDPTPSLHIPTELSFCSLVESHRPTAPPKQLSFPSCALETPKKKT